MVVCTVSICVSSVVDTGLCTSVCTLYKLSELIGSDCCIVWGAPVHCSAPFGIRFKESVDPRIKPFCVYSKVKIAGWTTVVSGAPVARPISGQVMGGCRDENSTPYVQITT